MRSIRAVAGRLAAPCGAWVLLLAACSPSLNWRTVMLPDAWLEASLPCRPESAARPVPWGGQAVSLSVTGCQVQGVLFAVSHLELDDASQAVPMLEQWQRSVRESMGVSPQVEASPFVPALALAVPASQRLRLQGRRTDGSTVAAQAVWFARLQGTHARLYHAIVYGPAVDAAAADAMFAGLKLLP